MENDLISRKEAIEWAKGIWKLICFYHPHSKSRNVPLDDVIDALERVPTKAVVSVKHGKPKVEFIESYIKVGNDYQWNDNHGELIRCKDCKYNPKLSLTGCPMAGSMSRNDESYCSWAERRGEE